MSALGVQSEPPPLDQSTYGTKDPILAATLGNFGFLARHSLPVMLVVSGAGVIDLVDKKTGRVQDCVHIEFRFESSIKHEVFGVIHAYAVFHAQEIAKLRQKKQTGDISRAEEMTLETKIRQWAQIAIGLGSHAGTLLWAVQLCYDQITNFLVVCTVTKELSQNPMIEFAKQINRGVAYAVEPMETEPAAQRRSERLFRN